MLVADLISVESMRRVVFPLLDNLSKDSVPNIRVNVSKAIMALAPYIKDNKEFIVRITLFSLLTFLLCLGLIKTDHCCLVEGG
jgi:hypothetical protein